MLKDEVEKEVCRIGGKLTREQTLTSMELAFLTEQLKTATELDILRSLFFCFRMLNDPAFAPLLEPHLHTTNVDIAWRALWVLCWPSRTVQTLHPGSGRHRVRLGPQTRGWQHRASRGRPAPEDASGPRLRPASHPLDAAGELGRPDGQAFAIGHELP